ncbi:protein white-like isoform X2 [Ostrea edulis]|uniref:protein white-like isoform X2 n=1 Tax=Ostrea edulis TaxID=37623 RepID=UPI0024AE94C3|nr:protein white-like isoform X2 [Ostrea edulis]
MSNAECFDNTIFEPALGTNNHRFTDRVGNNVIPQWQQVTLSWHDVTVTSIPRCMRRKGESPNKNILNKVCGVIKPGKLVAIMGASGAGKTTLMNVLTFRNIRSLSVSGDVKVNNRVVDREEINNVSAYLQQEDLFLGTMTVREHLTFKSCLQVNADTKARQRKVDLVIAELGLTKCADSMIGIPFSNQRISGGEKKRLAFASELLMNPPLMFCDEPTSGLDSFMATSVIQSLKMLAHKGHTIMCTIHQPSSEVFALFDEIYLLAEGHCVFRGYTMHALDFFKQHGYPCPVNYNPADHFILTLATIPGHERACHAKLHKLRCEFEKSQTLQLENGKHDSAPPTITSNGLSSSKTKSENGILSVEIIKHKETLPRYEAPFFKQLRYLLWRSWINNIRNPNMVIIKCAQAIVFPCEVPVFVREYGGKMYRLDVYYLSKIIVEIPFLMISPAIFITILYWMSGFVYGLSEYFRALGISILVANTAAGFGYVISAGAPSITAALALAPLLIMPLMMNGGFFLNSRTVPDYFLWLKYASWFMYSNELMIVNQWTSVPHIGCTNNGTCIPNGNLVIKSLGYSKDNEVMDWLCLAGLTIAFRVLSFIILLIKAKLSM